MVRPLPLQQAVRAVVRRPRTAPLRQPVSHPAAPHRSIASHPHPHQSAAISVLPTAVDTSSPEFKENAAQMGEVMAQLEELHARVARGGSDKAREKHVAKGKMLPRE